MAEEIISRDDARAQGLKSYFSGVPCKKGHFGRRSVKYGHCLTCSAEKTRQYRTENSEWYRRIDRKWKEENRDKVRAQARSRYAKDPQKFIDQTKRSYEKNPDRAIMYSRKRHAEKQNMCPEYRKKNVKRSSEWARKNPEKRRAQLHRQKAKRRAVPGTHTGDDILDIFEAQKGKCAYCRRKLKKYQVDHIVAIANGGTNHRHNLQLTCGPCNRSKSAKDPVDFAQSLGFLI